MCIKFLPEVGQSVDLNSTFNWKINCLPEYKTIWFQRKCDRHHRWTKRRHLINFFCLRQKICSEKPTVSSFLGIMFALMKPKRVNTHLLLYTICGNSFRRKLTTIESNHACLHVEKNFIYNSFKKSGIAASQIVNIE